MSTLMHYWEANIEATPAVSDVKFFVGNYAALFGTPAGAQLQAFCRDHRRVLVWALGPGMQGGHSIFSDNATFVVRRRVVDPLVLNATAAGRNLTLSFDTAGAHGGPLQAAFYASWQAVAAAREHGAAAEPSYWASAFAHTTDVVPPALRLVPLNAGACTSAADCIGVGEADHCLCYA